MKLMMQQYNAMPPDKPTETEIKQTYYAVDMLLFASGLMTATYDLTEALRDAGMLRHNVKMAMNKMDETVAKVSRVAYGVFTHGVNLGMPYIDRTEAAYKVIDESVAGVGEPVQVSKYLSICLALLELIAEYNDKLSTRFRFDAADRLKQLPAWLKTIPAPVNELAPAIIRQNVTAKNLNIKITE